MNEASLDNGDRPSKHELAVQAKDALAQAILQLYPAFRATVIDPPRDLSGHIGMNVRVTDQSGVNVVNSFSVEYVRCALETDFMRVRGSQEGVATEFGTDKSEEWTALKQDIVFHALQALPTKLRIILGQGVIPGAYFEQNKRALEEADMAHLIPSVTEALRYMYIRVAGSSVGFGE